MQEFILKYWLEVSFGAIIGFFGFIIKKIVNSLNKEMKDQSSIKVGVQAILRDRLINSYNYHIDLGFCSIHDRDNIINMYNQYHHLGVNGVVDSLMDELLSLPIKECNLINKSNEVIINKRD